MKSSTEIMDELEERLSAIGELKAMTREELDRVPYELKKWCCQVKGCTNGTKIRDYGIAPVYFWPVKTGGWVDLSNDWLICGKHNKLYKRLLKSFDRGHVHWKLLDHAPALMKKVIDLKPMQYIKSIEQ